MICISNMEHLPETCVECPCFVDIAEYGECCALYDDPHDIDASDRIKHCPLVQIEEQ